MRQRFGLLVGLLASTLLLFSACGGTDGGNNDDGSNGGGNGSDLEVAEHPNVDCTEDGDQSICTIQDGDVTEDLTLPNTEGVQYTLGGKVFIGDGESETTLTIEPGVTVFAQSGSVSDLAFLSIRRNAKIEAEGTADQPIVFTSSQAEGERARGDWGGLIINGKAPINVGDTARGEGGTGEFGGSSPEDSSGTLKYVRVEFAGALITEKEELNGIAFQGVGSGTTIDYVQVHKNSDDGVEFFGGTADAKHLVLTGIGDDSLDWTDGWKGKVQHVVAQQYDDQADRGIEADNLEADNDATPRSSPVISNMTIIGSSGGSEGVLLRRGTGAQLWNTIVTNAGGPCLDLDSQATFENAVDSNGELNGNLAIKNSIVNDGSCSKNFAADEEDFDPPFTVEEWFTGDESNQLADPKIKSPTSVEEPNFQIESGSPADTSSQQPEGSFFDDTDYIGGVGPDGEWVQGWTIATAN